MGLTSGAFQVLMICVAIAGLAAVVWAWPRVAGHSGRHLACRVGLLAGSQLLVVTAFLTGLNGYFGFIGGWSQLFGADRPARSRLGARPGLRPRARGPGPVIPDHRRAARARAARAAATARAPGRTPGTRPARPPARPGSARPGSARPGNGGQRAAPGPAVTGRLVQVSMTGPRTGITVRGDYVYLPPQYFQPAYARARFPVVLALTGTPARPDAGRAAGPAGRGGRAVAAGGCRPVAS